MNVLILGGIITDKYMFVNEYPKCGTDAFIKETFDVPGGCSLNVAMTLKNLGVNPFLFSKIGDDEDGQLIKDYLQGEHLDTRYIESIKGKTDYCLVIVDGQGERTFLTYDKLDRHISDQMMEKMLEMSYDSVYVTGYFMVKTETTSNKLALLKALANKGTKMLFDPGAIVGEIDQTVLKELIDLAYIMTPNRYEAHVISSVLNQSLESYVKASSYLIIKDGGEVLNLHHQNKSKRMTPYKTRVVDTTGAGDSFAGGLLYGLSKGLKIEEATRIGMACGALTTTFKEPHGQFSLDRINEIIEIGSVIDEK